MIGRPAPWRETMKPVRFLVFEGRVVLVLFPTLLHLRWWTLAVAASVMLLMWWFERRRGVPAEAIFRYLKARLIGARRSARGVHEERLPVDFHFEGAALRRLAAKPARAAPAVRKGRT